MPSNRLCLNSTIIPNDEMFMLPTGEGDSLEVYPARKDEEIVGYAVNHIQTKVSADICLYGRFQT